MAALGQLTTELNMTGAPGIVGADEQLVEEQDVHSLGARKIRGRACRTRRTGILPPAARPADKETGAADPTARLRPSLTSVDGGRRHIMFDLANSSFTISQASWPAPGTLATAK